ncbi:MAG: TolB family protein [Sandaracinaceae bacterium]
MRRAALPFLLCFAMACGARTGLDDPPTDAGTFDAAPPECARDSMCDDGVSCTEDRCSGGRCVHTTRDERCADDDPCTVAERCDPTLGCTSQPNRCDDAVACTLDSCDPSARGCQHEARFDLCPLSHRCDLSVGCVARALVHDPQFLYEIDLPSGALRELTRSELDLTDLALHPDGTAYGITAQSLFTIDQATGLATFVAMLDARNVGLDVTPDGDLVVAGPRLVSRLDRVTGASTPFATFPGGLSASGDIATVEGRMLITATTSVSSRTLPDVLVEVPPDGGEAVVVGSVGFPCVWGLAPFGPSLYGFTCAGYLLEIDPFTGEGRRLAMLGRQFGGAAAR